MDARAAEFNSNPESETLSPTALYIPANEEADDTTSDQTHSPPKLPPRLRRRLLQYKTPSPTSQDIEAKLRDAHLRRQQFYEVLSTKARSKSRSSAWPSVQEEGLGQRIEAKLYAAKLKRLSILANVQKRLSTMDGLRQAAKHGLEMRLGKERDELGAKVESRVQKAEANRMVLFTARVQRKNAKEERISQILTKRLIQEKKYKELVSVSIHRKRAAAEKKRLGLLEAEKLRVQTRALKVQQKANAVQSRQDIERRRRKNQLEAKLQRAKRLRMVYLSKRANLGTATHYSSAAVDCGNLLSRKLARCWKRFVKEKGTTFSLAKAYAALEINEKSVSVMPFEVLAGKIESSVSIRTAKTLLNRLEKRIRIKQEVAGSNQPFSLERIDHLLKRVMSSSKGFTRVVRKGGLRKVDQGLVKLSRYPVRVVFCAYMILVHPDAVFSGKGEYEIDLAKSAKNFIQEFELLIRIILEGPDMSSLTETSSSVGSQLSFMSQLESFDKAWCSYLNAFVTWKVEDAKLLQGDLVRAACQLELKMIENPQQSSKDCSQLKGDIKAFQEKVTEIKKLLQVNMQQSIVLNSSEFSDSEATNDSRKDESRACHGAGNRPIRNDVSMSNVAGSSTSSITVDTNLPRSATSETDNEVLVNEIVHGHKRGLFDDLSITPGDKEGMKSMVRDNMEKAFWDGVLESMKQNEPDYSWVLKLMKEVRDELCAMSPSIWRQEIFGAIDVNILSQVLKSGVKDMDYLGRILEFAMVTLQRLSAPANENELKATHKKLLEDLNEISQAADSDASFAVVMIKGLRAVLQQIQRLKHDINKARIGMMEPLIKGPAGFEYLKSAFASRYGNPADAPVSLPLVLQWFSSMMLHYEEEWKDYSDSISTVSNRSLSPTTLRAGGSILQEVTVGCPTITIAETECKGEKVDLLLRLGLLNLVNEVEGLTLETLPETLKLNFFKLRDVQSQLQKVIVISSSILVLRQTLLSERLLSSPTDMEDIISDCVKRLSELLDSSEDVGVPEMVQIMNCFSEGGDLEKCRSRKELMANMLAKSLREGDAVFTQVSRTVYLAARGIVLAGSGMKGKELAEAMLKRIGASHLTEKLVEAVEELVVMANVSASVHRAWYEQILYSIH